MVAELRQLLLMRPFDSTGLARLGPVIEAPGGIPQIAERVVVIEARKPALLVVLDPTDDRRDHVLDEGAVGFAPIIAPAQWTVLP